MALVENRSNDTDTESRSSIYMIYDENKSAFLFCQNYPTQCQESKKLYLESTQRILKLYFYLTK